MGTVDARDHGWTARQTRVGERWAPSAARSAPSAAVEYFAARSVGRLAVGWPDATVKRRAWLPREDPRPATGGVVRLESHAVGRERDRDPETALGILLGRVRGSEDLRVRHRGGTVRTKDNANGVLRSPGQGRVGGAVFEEVTPGKSGSPLLEGSHHPKPAVTPSKYRRWPERHARVFAHEDHLGVRETRDQHRSARRLP